MKTLLLLQLGFMLAVSGPEPVPFGYGTARFSNVQQAVKPAVYTNEYYPATMDSAGIQGAIDAANADGGGTVKLSASIYRIDSPVDLKSNVRIRGEGAGQTVIKRSEGFVPGPNKHFFGADNASLQDIEIRELTMDGDRNAQELIDGFLGPEQEIVIGVGIRSGAGTYNERIRLFKLEVKGFHTGIQISGATHIRIEYSDIHDNGCSYLHHNIYFRRTGLGLVYQCTIYNAIGGSGLKLAGGTSVVPDESQHFTILDNRIYNNERINLNIQDCNSILIAGNVLRGQHSDSNSYLAGLYLTGSGGYDGRYADIINNEIYGNIRNGIFVCGCNFFSIEGNACLDNGRINYDIAGSSDYFCDYNSSY